MRLESIEASGEGFHTVESFIPSRNQWVPRPPLFWKNIHVAGASVKDRVFVVGGANGRQCPSEVEYLDLDIGKWIPTCPMLSKAFQNKRFAHAVNQRTLDNLITELLLSLSDERVPRMDDGSQLLKALNVLVLKILDNTERTSSFVVLVSLLKPLDPSRWPSPPSNESFATRNMKFSDLVV